MENDNDISFCQVSLPVDQNPVSRTCNVDIKGKYSNSTGGTERRLVIWLHRLSDDYVIGKKKTVGSSSFSLVDASASRVKSRKLARREASTSAGTYIKNVPEQKVPAARKPFPRTKVPFEKGYSQMDWLKLTRTNADLAGLKGQSKTRIVTMDEVKKHQTAGSMWTVLKGRVYNLSPYMKFHPGGVDILMKAVGKDCTALFNQYHPWVNPEFLLEKCLVGTLDQ